MKIKFLKKLRKKSEKKLFIERIKYTYSFNVYERNIFGRKKVLKSFDRLYKAMEYCDSLKRNYILKKLTDKKK